VPLGALIRDAGHWAVYRIEHGRARLRAIQAGTLTDRTAEVLGGTGPGDVLIVYPSDQVHEGLRVRGSHGFGVTVTITASESNG
jgi:HlyD family secretion protein